MTTGAGKPPVSVKTLTGAQETNDLNVVSATLKGREEPQIEVIEYPTAVDLAQLLRCFDSRNLGETRGVTISHCPRNVLWALELLKQEARRTDTATVAFLLSRAHSRMWEGVGPIREARNHILAYGLPETRHFLDACPPPELVLGNSGDKRWVTRIPEQLVAQYATLAGTLGLANHKSYVLSIAMCTGLMGAGIVPVGDRPSLIENVKRYRSLVMRRAALTRELDCLPRVDPATQLQPWGLDD